MSGLERGFERLLFAFRWLLAPIYLGLGLLLLIFSVHFAIELWHLGARMFSLTETELVLGALSLIDFALVSGLVVMVMLSGYENYVSTLDLAESEKTLSWLGKLDSGTLKLKVAAAIVAISAIQLLKGFMEVENMASDKLMWMVIIHLTFVVSALLLTVMDKMMAVGDRH